VSATTPYLSKEHPVGKKSEKIFVPVRFFEESVPGNEGTTVRGDRRCEPEEELDGELDGAGDAALAVGAQSSRKHLRRAALDNYFESTNSANDNANRQ
jgi:hypothetical protein